jgi:transcription elongation factor Elf1
VKNQATHKRKAEKETGGDEMPTKFCPHCGERSGFEVRFNIFYRIGDKEQGKGFLRICKMCGGRFITTPEDEGLERGIREKTGDK